MSRGRLPQARAALGINDALMPSRRGEKNNRYLIGHAAYGQGLTQLEHCEFEDAATSLEGAWSVWKDVFMNAADDASDDESGSATGEDDEEQSRQRDSSNSASDTSSSSEPDAPRLERRERRERPKDLAQKRFARRFAKRCQNQGAGVGGTLPPRAGAVSSTGEQPVLKGFAEDEDAPHQEEDEFLGTWPPSSTVDTFASALNDALMLRVTKEAEEEAFACAMEAQAAVNRSKEVESEEETAMHDPEDEEFTTDAYNLRMYKQDVQMMTKEREELKPKAPQRVFGAKPQFHHFRRLLRGLCHCYVRLRRWIDLDNFIAEAVQHFKEANSPMIPRFRTKEREELWIVLQLQRAIACILVGREHFDKADRYLNQVRLLQPKARSLARAVQSIRFLREQLRGSSLSADSEDALLTQALLSLK